MLVGKRQNILICQPRAMPRFEAHSEISPVTETGWAHCGVGARRGPGGARLGRQVSAPTRGILSCFQEGPELSKRQ